MADKSISDPLCRNKGNKSSPSRFFFQLLCLLIVCLCDILFVCLFVCLFVYMFVCLFLYLFVCVLFVCLFVCLFVFLGSRVLFE